MWMVLMVCVACQDPFVSAGVEPQWIQVPVLRPMDKVKGSTVLADIESRMPAGHGYAFPAMPMTWAHETSHGLASRLRQQQGGRVNVLYCLNGRAAVIREPRARLSGVAALVPRSLQGPSFRLYLVEQRRYWENEPSYVLDEWTAYINGSECGRQVRENGWHYELLQACNFCVYSLAMAQHVTAVDPQYDHTQLRAFIGFNLDRTLAIWKQLEASGVDDSHVRQIRAYLKTFRESDEARPLREFAQRYLQTAGSMAGSIDGVLR